MTNWDGNRLRGNFYTFQVGPVRFISLDADDVIYQDGAANYVINTPNTKPETTTTGAEIPNGTTTYTRFYTADLKLDAKDNSLVPDRASGTPNLQALWLEDTLARARRDPSVDMIVVFMHQCARPARRTTARPRCRRRRRRSSCSAGGSANGSSERAAA